MSVPFGMKMLCDISFLLFVTGVPACLAGSEVNMLPWLLLAVFAMLLSFALRRRFIARFLPILLCFGAFPFLAGDVPAIIMYGIAMVYAAYVIYKGAYFVTKDSFQAVFSRNLKIAGVVMLLGLFNRAGFEATVLPMGIYFALSGLFLTRTLRHDIDIIVDKRFSMLNTAALVSMCLAGLLFSQPFWLEAIKNGLSVVYFNVIAPILVVVSYIIAMVLGPILSALIKDRSGETAPQQDADNIYGPEGYEDFILDGSTGDTSLLVLKAAAILLAVIFLIWLLKRMTGDPVRVARIEYTLQKERSREKNKKKNHNIGPVREIYRKYLKLLKKHGITAADNSTSRDVHIDALREIEGFPVHDGEALRDAYISARYSHGQGTAQASKAYKNIKAFLSHRKP